jgi:hypothetical protein
VRIRALLTLKYVDGLSDEEIAELTDIGVSAAKRESQEPRRINKIFIRYKFQKAVGGSIYTYSKGDDLK